MAVIHTERLRLRPLHEPDRAAVHELLSDPQVMRFIGPRRVMTTIEIDAWFATQLQDFAHGNRRHAVALRTTDEFIGMVGLQMGSTVNDFGYYFLRCSWGHGYALEACRAALAALQGMELEIFIAADNTASARVMTRLGHVATQQGTRHGEAGWLYTPALGGRVDMQPYLTASEWIDSAHPEVVAQARALAEGAASPREVAERCFAFVRDAIRHSSDYRLNPVTCRASDVLRHGTGYCYAKSHLLAALLRANGIPAGLCYQRLSVGDSGAPYCLHGLNAVHLSEHGWYRIDARGDKPGIAARFTPPVEALAFVPRNPGERDLPGIHAEPLPQVVAVLTTQPDYAAVLRNLPDVAP